MCLSVRYFHEADFQSFTPMLCEVLSLQKRYYCKTRQAFKWNALHMSFDNNSRHAHHFTVCSNWNFSVVSDYSLADICQGYYSISVIFYSNICRIFSVLFQCKMWFSIVLTAAVVYIFRIYYNSFRAIFLSRKVVGPPALPIIGSAFYFLNKTSAGKHERVIQKLKDGDNNANALLLLFLLNRNF